MNAILQATCDRLRARESVGEPLDDLLAAMQARAVGLWRVEGASLVQLGFRAVPDMPEEVQRTFAEATRNVPLSQTGLGIVQAAVTGQPAVATLDHKAGLSGSAGWLAKFGAVQSAAFPILAGTEVRGVLAVSTATPLVRGDERWKLMEGLAEGLAGVV